MIFWLVTGGLFLAAAIGAWPAPARPWIRWLLPAAALALGSLLLIPARGISLPMIVCSGQSDDCHLSGTAYSTLFGLDVPAADRWGYGEALVLAVGIAIAVAATSWTLLTYRGRSGHGRRRRASRD